MRERWLRIGILAGVLVAINLVGRLVVRLGSIEDVDAQQWASVVTYLTIALAMAVVAAQWIRQRATGVVTADLAGGAVAAGVLILIVGPFVSGTSPAAVGVGDSFEAAWQYAVYAAGGALVGGMATVMLGRDYTSRSLHRFAQAKLVKPGR